MPSWYPVWCPGGLPREGGQQEFLDPLALVWQNSLEIGINLVWFHNHIAKW